MTRPDIQGREEFGPTTLVSRTGIPKEEFGRQRGQFVDSPFAPYATATVHPSLILRAPDDESRHSQMREFVEDLRK